MAGISSKAAGTLQNKYQYNGKELQNKEFSDGGGLETYDFGARTQDPQIGRWWQIDPKANKFSIMSPYCSFANNPIFFVDPDGREIINGETNRRKSLESEKKLIMEAFKENYGGDMNKSRNDFSSSNEWNAYKGQKSNLLSMDGKIEKARSNENKINLAILDFMLTDPAKFKEANNLTYKDASGKENSIDIFLKSGDASLDGGAVTKVAFFQDKDDNYNSIKSITTTLDFSIISPKSYALAHEMGHAYNNAKNPARAMNMRLVQECQDPRNRESFQSKTAMDWQDSYIEKSKSPSIWYKIFNSK